jgi:hypothetical protein
MDTVDTTVGGRVGRFGSGMVRLAAAAVLVLLVLGATMDAAGATNHGGPSGPRATFIKNCRASGGTVMEGAGDNEASVSCTHRNPDGSITDVDCEFTGPILWYCNGQTRPSTNVNLSARGKPVGDAAGVPDDGQR